MNRFFLISISLLIFIIGIGCVAAADLDSGIVDSSSLGSHDPVYADSGVQLSKWGDKSLYSENDAVAVVASDDGKLSKWGDKSLYSENDAVAVVASDDGKLSNWDDKRLYSEDNLSSQSLGQQQPQPFEPVALGNIPPQYLGQQQPQPFEPVALGSSCDRRLFVDAPA